MPVATYLHTDPSVRVSAFSGRVVPDDLSRLGRMFHNGAAFRATDPAFCIFRPDVNLSAIDPEDLLDLEITVGEAFAGKKHETLKVAIVAKSASVYSELRLWRELTKSSSSYRYTFDVFETLVEAVAWQRLSPDWAQRIRELEGFRQVA